MYVDHLFRSFKNLDYPNYELVFVDGGSTDQTLYKLKKYSVKIVEAPNSNIAQARNIGIHSSTGELLAFIDHDCIPHRRWAKRLAYYILSDPLVGGAGGSNYIKTDGTTKSESIAAAINSWLGSGGSTQFFKYKNVRIVPAVPACNMMFRRTILEKVGFFDPNLLYCEDADICKRVTKLGYKIIYVPSSIVHHHIRLNSFKRIWTHFFSWGLGRTYGARKKKCLFSRTSVALMACSVFMFIIASLSFFHRLFLLMSMALAVGYFATLFFTSLKLKMKAKGSIKLRYAFFAFLVEHIAYTLGLFFGLVAKRPLAYRLHNKQYVTRDKTSAQQFGKK
jgi:GT2 family glycosyltransferase